MADSIQETMMDDNLLEDFAEIVRGRDPESTGNSQTQENASKVFNLLKEEMKQSEIKEQEALDLKNKVAKLESQIGRILIHLGIAQQDEIIVTNEMPVG
jgi:hypothetical protein